MVGKCVQSRLQDSQADKYAGSVLDAPSCKLSAWNKNSPVHIGSAVLSNVQICFLKLHIHAVDSSTLNTIILFIIEKYAPLPPKIVISGRKFYINSI
jgi:hypothetical protein